MLDNDLFSDTDTLEPTQNFYSNPSTKTQKQIQKLLDAEEAQKKRTWSYYQTMLKEKPSLYWSAKTQYEMHQDAEALGQAFEDGDFNDE